MVDGKMVKDPKKSSAFRKQMTLGRKHTVFKDRVKITQCLGKFELKKRIAKQVAQELAELEATGEII